MLCEQSTLKLRYIGICINIFDVTSEYLVLLLCFILGGGGGGSFADGVGWITY